MTYPDQLIKLIDERADKRIAAFAKGGGSLIGATPGTVVHRDSLSVCQVTLDGSALAVPVKVLGAVELLAGDRVGLLRIGTDWVVIDTFTRRRSLTVPDGADVDEPATVIGPDIPALLLSQYEFFGATVHAATIHRINETEYSYDALYSFGGSDVAIGRGNVAGGIVYEALSVGADTGIGIAFLNRFGNTEVAISNAVFPGGAFTIDGISAPRGRRDFVSSTADTSAIGAEAVVLTSASITWLAGRAYEVLVFNPAITGSVGSNNALRRIRRNNVAGADKSDVTNNQNNTVNGTGVTTFDRVIIRNNTGSDVTDNIVATMQADTGTVVSKATSPRVRYMEIRDVGAAADYPSAVGI